MIKSAWNKIFTTALFTYSKREFNFTPKPHREKRNLENTKNVILIMPIVYN